MQVQRLSACVLEAGASQVLLPPAALEGHVSCSSAGKGARADAAVQDLAFPPSRRHQNRQHGSCGGTAVATVGISAAPTPYPRRRQVSMAQGMRKWLHRVRLKLCLCSPPATSRSGRRQLLGRPGILQSDSPLAFHHQLSASQEEQPEAQLSQLFSSQLFSPAFGTLVQRPEASLLLSCKAELKTLTWLASTS